MKKPVYCQQCGSSLTEAEHGGRMRMVCTNDACKFIYWDNPTPIVAAVVEYGNDVVLVRSIGWPEGWFGLVTGFLESGEMPDEAVQREVKEETGLNILEYNYIGMYPFYRMNQLIIAYHVKAEGEIKLDTTELEDYKQVPIDKVRPWGSGTGYALQDWLRSRGIEKEVIKFGS
jgi:NADH pyrophosphatase NudC (nudix superfamily)